VGPHPGEPGKEILELRQLDLELGLMAAGPGRKDVQNDFGPIHNPDVELALEIGPLDRR
jgi:hypothetical protein